MILRCHSKFCLNLSTNTPIVFAKNATVLSICQKVKMAAPMYTVVRRATQKSDAWILGKNFFCGLLRRLIYRVNPSSRNDVIGQPMTLPSGRKWGENKNFLDL